MAESVIRTSAAARGSTNGVTDAVRGARQLAACSATFLSIKNQVDCHHSAYVTTRMTKMSVTQQSSREVVPKAKNAGQIGGAV
jgi:hypothetical protein